jgi:hypothetical protein
LNTSYITPTVLISLDVLTLSVFDAEYALAERANPVIVIVVDAAAAAIAGDTFVGTI